MSTLGEGAVNLLVCFKTKEMNSLNTALCFYINILPWLSLLHFHQLVSFVEDRNAAIIMFSFFKGSRPVDSQPTTESLVNLSRPTA